MDSSFSQPSSWALGITFAVLLPWAVLSATRWIILRTAEERLRAIPLSIWQPLYNRMLALSEDALFQFSKSLSGTGLYQAFNPERCNQQTRKVLIPYTEALTDQLIRPLSPVIWDNLPTAVRVPIYQRVANRFKPCIDLIIVNFETIIVELMNHRTFIAKGLKAQETGYRFIPSEALHHYWHSLHSKSRSISLLVAFFYLILGSIWPALAYQEALLFLPLIVTLVCVWRTPAIDVTSIKSFARCLGYWLGERLYLIDNVVKHFSTSDCDQSKVQQLISQAFQPLVEDLPLKTLAQVSLGRHALLDIRQGLVNYVMLNGSIPFEHSQFQQERAIEVSNAYTKSIQTMSINEINQHLTPTMQLIHQLLTLVTLSVGVITLLILWYFTRM